MPIDNITILKDNSKLFGDELKRAILRALERCGSQAEGYAKDLCPISDTGEKTLQQSITHKIDEKNEDVYIGTNVEYGAYVELGTGKYYPGGRPTPWNYEDENGDWHHTEGQEAQPYLVPAAKDHAQTYRNIFKDELGT
jgi:phage gpG-like protein